MEIVAAAAILPMGLLFLFSGLIVNLVQAIFFILLRPLSRNMFRRVNVVVIESFFLEFVWLAAWWANMKIYLISDSETHNTLGKEHALFIPNHSSDIDWIGAMIISQRFGCLGSSMSIIKKSAKYIPAFGWTLWLSDSVFLDRNWAKDESNLKSSFQRLKDFPRPLWMLLFVEGTRLTKAKLLAAREYAASKGLPMPKNVLIPRTKISSHLSGEFDEVNQLSAKTKEGFVSAVNNTRSFVPAIYDVTAVFHKDQPMPTILTMLKRQPIVAHVYLKRHPMNELPHTDDGIAQWCRDLFTAKDDRIEQHHAVGAFHEKVIPLGRSRKSLLVVFAWSFLLLFTTYKFLKWSALLSTWKGVALATTAAGLFTSFIQILILFSQAERSNHAKIPSPGPCDTM